MVDRSGKSLSPLEAKAIVSSPVITFQEKAGLRGVIYGTGGIGKTSLCALLSKYGRTVILDLDRSLNILKAQFEAQGLDDIVSIPVSSFPELIDVLHLSGWDDVKNIVIDSATRVEELIAKHVLKTVSTEKGLFVKSIEDYGYGKGYVFIYDAFLRLLDELEVFLWSGVNVIFTAHDCVVNVPNPNGDDWIRYEPRLQSPPSGKSSIRQRVKEWADIMAFLSYDMSVDRKGKAKAKGTRTIYPFEQSFCMAKTRIPIDVMPYDEGSAEFWNILFGGAK